MTNFTERRKYSDAELQEAVALIKRVLPDDFEYVKKTEGPGVFDDSDERRAVFSRIIHTFSRTGLSNKLTEANMLIREIRRVARAEVGL